MEDGPKYQQKCRHSEGRRTQPAREIGTPKASKVTPNAIDGQAMQTASRELLTTSLRATETRLTAVARGPRSSSETSPFLAAQWTNTSESSVAHGLNLKHNEPPDSEGPLAVDHGVEGPVASRIRRRSSDRAPKLLWRIPPSDIDKLPGTGLELSGSRLHGGHYEKLP